MVPHARFNSQWASFLLPPAAVYYRRQLLCAEGLLVEKSARARLCGGARRVCVDRCLRG